MAADGFLRGLTREELSRLHNATQALMHEHMLIAPDNPYCLALSRQHRAIIREYVGRGL